MKAKVAEVVNKIDQVLELCNSFPRRGQLTVHQARVLEVMIRELERVKSLLCDQEQTPFTRLFGAVAWSRIIGKLAELVIEFFKDQL